MPSALTGNLRSGDLYALALLKTGQEKSFQAEATEVGAACYFPLQSRITRPRRKHQPVISTRPLFPGYAFIKMARGMMQVRSIRSFRRFLMIEDEIVPVPDYEIERLRDREMGGEFADRALPHQVSFSIGQQIRVSDGAFIGYSGTVDDVASNGKYIIDLKGWKVIIPVDHLESVL